MRFLFHIFSLVGLSVLVGCGSGEQPVPSNPEPPTPLTFEEWQKLEISYKYDPAAFDRLRMGDPSLKSEAAWDKYFNSIILPERQKDIPPTPAGQ